MCSIDYSENIKQKQQLVSLSIKAVISSYKIRTSILLYNYRLIQYCI